MLSFNILIVVLAMIDCFLADARRRTLWADGERPDGATTHATKVLGSWTLYKNLEITLKHRSFSVNGPSV